MPGPAKDIFDLLFDEESCEETQAEPERKAEASSAAEAAPGDPELEENAEGCSDAETVPGS